MKKMKLVVAGFVLVSGVAVQAADISYSGTAGGDLATGSNWSTGAFPTESDCAILNNTANLNSSLWDYNLLAIHVGSGGTGVLTLQEGAYLKATVHASWDSRIGSDKGNGSVYQSGGIAEFNFMCIGWGGEGLYSLIGGEAIITRGQEGYSLYIGTDHKKRLAGGSGTFEISGGRFSTRTGVYLGHPEGSSTGTFSVQGSGATQIGVGSANSGDGTWVQNTGSILKVGIDSSGVTKIFIDEVDGGGQSVTFEAGSLLDVDYCLGGSGSGSWVVMELENADIMDNGLKFAPGVDLSVWSFEIDNSGENGVLKVTAKGGPVNFG